MKANPDKFKALAVGEKTSALKSVLINGGGGGQKWSSVRRQSSF